MKKLSLLIIVGAFLIGACSTTSAEPAKDWVDVNKPTEQDCFNGIQNVAQKTQQLEIRSNNLLADPSRIPAFIADSRVLIAETRAFINDCGHYVPSESQELSRTTDSLESSVDELEDIYNQIFG